MQKGKNNKEKSHFGVFSIFLQFFYHLLSFNIIAPYFSYTLVGPTVMVQDP